jgi:hypothetical protein
MNQEEGTKNIVLKYPEVTIFREVNHQPMGRTINYKTNSGGYSTSSQAYFK